jgi:hypothetical protein
VLLSSTGTVSRTVLLGGEGWLARADVDVVLSGVDVSVAPTSDELAARVLKDIDAALETKPADPNRIDMVFRFWAAEGRGVRTRTIEAAPWQEIDRNYPKAAREHLAHLVALTPEHLAGRLILLNGPPDTGKTTYLRALASALPRPGRDRPPALRRGPRVDGGRGGAPAAGVQPRRVDHPPRRWRDCVRARADDRAVRMRRE